MDELDQEWSELLEELRTMMPGVEVLFGFLLVLPFTEQFVELNTAQRYLYFGALASAAIANVLLISPTANHRLRWRRHDKERMLRSSTRNSIAGLAFIALAMVAAVLLISGYLFGPTLASIAAAALAALFLWFWFVYPLIARSRLPRRER